MAPSSTTSNTKDTHINNTATTWPDPVTVTVMDRRDVNVFPIPPRASSQGYKVADWDQTKAWTGRCVVSVVTYTCTAHAVADLGPLLNPKQTARSVCVIRFEDQSTGALFGECIVCDTESDVERVLDSSRFFVLKLVDRVSGRTAFAGFGFNDRSDAFDFNVVLQEFAKISTYDIARNPIPHFVDRSLKQGQVIKLNLPNLSNKIGITQTLPSSNTTAVLGEPVPLPKAGLGQIHFLQQSFHISHSIQSSPAKNALNPGPGNIDPFAEFQ